MSTSGTQRQVDVVEFLRNQAMTFPVMSFPLSELDKYVMLRTPGVTGSIGDHIYFYDMQADVTPVCYQVPTGKALYIVVMAYDQNTNYNTTGPILGYSDSAGGSVFRGGTPTNPRIIISTYEQNYFPLFVNSMVPAGKYPFLRTNSTAVLNFKLHCWLDDA